MKHCRFDRPRRPVGPNGICAASMPHRVACLPPHANGRVLFIIQPVHKECHSWHACARRRRSQRGRTRLLHCGNHLGDKGLSCQLIFRLAWPGRHPLAMCVLALTILALRAGSKASCQQYVDGTAICWNPGSSLLDDDGGDPERVLLDYGHVLLDRTTVDPSVGLWGSYAVA